MIDEQRHYLSYLLRLWRDRATLPPVWRASLEDPHTGERWGFADIAQLFAFVREQVADESARERHNAPEGGPAERSLAEVEERDRSTGGPNEE